MDNRTHTRFDMGAVLNKLRSIAEEAPQNTMVNDDNFTKVMGRLTGVKDALPTEQFDNLRAGIRSLYMNQRPSQAQMSAMLGLLETMLGYIASDSTLFQRLKGDLMGNEEQGPQAQEPEAQDVSQPEEQEPQEQEPEADEPKVEPGMRGLK